MSEPLPRNLGRMYLHAAMTLILGYIAFLETVLVPTRGIYLQAFVVGLTGVLALLNLVQAVTLAALLAVETYSKRPTKGDPEA